MTLVHSCARIAPRGRRTALAIAMLLAVGLGAGSACNPWGGSDEKMPNVVGKPEAEARKTLEDLGLTVETTKKRTGATVGNVVDQSPHANDPVPDDLKATLIIEDFAATGTAGVPNVVGKSVHEAEDLLTQAGFRRGNLTTQISSQPKDTVLDQNPKAGSNVAAGTLVDLLFAGEWATVPNVMGQTEVNAIKLLAEQRLRIGNVGRVLDRPGAPGTILDQNPRAELMVAFETPVDLVIKEDGVTVPAVENKILDDVATTLLTSGLSYKLAYRVDLTRPFGTILSLAPSGGQLVPRNSEVTVTVARPKRPVLDWGVADKARLRSLERFQLQMQMKGGRIKPQ